MNAHPQDGEAPENTPRGFVRSVIALPRNIFAMVRAGQPARASIHCLLGVLLGFGVLSVWLLPFGVVYIAFQLNALSMAGMELIGLIIVLICAAPGIVALLVGLIGSAAGVVLGLMGLLRGQDALTASVGLVLNGVLLGFLIALIWPGVLSLFQ